MARLAPHIDGRRVALDTAPLIYYIEAHPAYLILTDELFEAIAQGQAVALTSVLTLLEVLVRPLREGRADMAAAYRQLLTNAANLTLYALDQNISERAAQLRSRYAWLRTPDAIQIATALAHSADVIITNDERWRRVTELEVLVLQDHRAPGP